MDDCPSLSLGNVSTNGEGVSLSLKTEHNERAHHNPKVIKMHTSSIPCIRTYGYRTHIIIQLCMPDEGITKQYR